MMRKLLILLFLFPIICSAQLVINEFSSVGGYQDANGKNSDWLEVINTGITPINLSDYFLSDKLNNLSKWNFPKEQLDSMQHYLILCSGLNRHHRIRSWQSIINTSTQWSYLAASSQPDSNWKSVLYNDTAWNIGYMGFGSGDNDDSTYISGVSSFYLRTKFTVLDTLSIHNLVLHADYDDAFIAYLNGVEIARSKNIYLSNYNALATSAHEALIYRNLLHEEYIINNALIDSVLYIGDNVLAIQIHDVDSIPSDMSASFFLHAGINSDSIYFNPKTDWFEDSVTFYHTNFKISDNETIFISDSLGNILDQKAITTSRALISEGRAPTGIGSWCYFSDPSPGQSNISNWCYNGISEDPSISLSSGWYVNQEYVTINVPNYSNVYYTVNGDVPDTNDFRYVDTLWFDSTIVLSVRAFSINGFLSSNVVDRTYIFNEDNFGLPVFSIITDSLNLWDWNTGIYVLGPNADSLHPYYGANFWNSWSRWSRLEFFDKNKNKQAEEQFDLEIFGGWSRTKPQKSFTLDFKSIYSGDLEWPLISEKPHLQKFNNINLRNGGSNNGKGRIRDALVAQLALVTNNDVLGYDPCIVYLNGKYWGLYGIREKMDEHYIEANHAIDSDSVDIIKSDNKIVTGSDSHFIDTYHSLMNINPASPYFFDFMKKRFDIDNIIDYFIVETYIGNTDWLRKGALNLKLWRPQNAFGKWRYMLYDTDMGLGGPFYSSPSSNSFQMHLVEYLNYRPNKHSDLLARFLKNNDFRCKLGKRYTHLVNTIFDVDYVSMFTDTLKNEINNAMPTHINRWNQPSNMWNWENSIKYIKDYNKDRSDYIIEYLLPYLNVSASISLSFNVFPPQSGSTKINELLKNTYPWIGIFIQDLCPDTLVALPDSGYFFSHWESNHIIGNQIYNDTIDLYLSQDDTITAHFRECRISNLYLMQDSMVNSFAPIFDIGYGPYSYQWFLDNDTIFAEDSLISPVRTGLYSVSVTDKDGCNTVSPSVLFDCNILVEADLIQDTITNSLNVSCTGGTSPYTYDWFYNNTPVIALFDSTHYPLETGSYHFLVTDSNGCQSLTDTIFTKDCGFVIESSLTQDTITSNLHINSLGGTDPYSYQWFLDSIFVEDIDKSFLNVYTYGTYYAIIEDINGCKSFTDTISNKKLDVNIFPNPTNRLMNIKFIRLHGEKYTISVYDLQMNILYYIELPKTDHNMFYTHTFNLDINRTGLYLIRLESSKSQISKRFIYEE